MHRRHTSLVKEHTKSLVALDSLTTKNFVLGLFKCTDAGELAGVESEARLDAVTAERTERVLTHRVLTRLHLTLVNV